MTQFSNLIVLIFFCSVLFISSGCKKDPVRGCTDHQAENYDPKAEESDDSCIYARDKFLGVYQVTQTCDTYDVTYSITIEESSNNVDVAVISGFNGFYPLPITIDGSNFSFNTTLNTEHYNGTGTLNGNHLTMFYTEQSGTYSEQCSISGIKQ